MRIGCDHRLADVPSYLLDEPLSGVPLRPFNAKRFLKFIGSRSAFLHDLPPAIDTTVSVAQTSGSTVPIRLVLFFISLAIVMIRLALRH